MRREQAEAKVRLKRGEMSLAEFFEKADQNESLGAMRPLSLLEALPAMGKVKARRIFEESGIAPTRRVRGLGSKQREALLTLVSDRSARS